MGDGDGEVAWSFRFPGTGITGARDAGSVRSPAWRRQASRSPPSAYRIRRVARRPGGPARLRATITSVRWPTTSRPSRIHDRRASSSRIPVASPTAPATPPAAADPRLATSARTTLGGSSTTRVMPARRASAASRPSRSANLASVPPPAGAPPRPRPGPPPLASARFGSRAGRSMTSRSTARPDRSEPAMARPSSGSAGVTTTSHSGWIPRATASTGSSAAVRSSQATIEPAAWASAASRSASVVRPLEASPRSATPMPRGTPPGPRIASSSANPVERIRSGSACRPAPGCRSTPGCLGCPGTPLGSGKGLGCGSSGASSGTVASAPTTSPT